MVSDFRFWISDFRWAPPPGTRAVPDFRFRSAKGAVPPGNRRISDLSASPQEPGCGPCLRIQDIQISPFLRAPEAPSRPGTREVLDFGFSEAAGAPSQRELALFRISDPGFFILGAARRAAQPTDRQHDVCPGRLISRN